MHLQGAGIGDNNGPAGRPERLATNAVAGPNRFQDPVHPCLMAIVVLDFFQNGVFLFKRDNLRIIIIIIIINYAQFSRFLYLRLYL